MAAGFHDDDAAARLGLAHWWLDPARGKVRIGPGWRALIGTAAGPSTAQALGARVHPDDRAAFARMIAADTATARNLRVLGDDGRVLPVLCRVAPGPEGLSGVWIETGEAAPLAADPAAGPEASAQRALAALPDGIAVYDPDDRLVLTNDRMGDLFGYPDAAPLIGRRFEDQVRDVLDRSGVPEARGREEDWLADFLARRAAGDVEFETELADGRVIRMHDRVLPDGWRVGTRTDVTDLRRAEREASATLAHLRSAIESLPDAVFLLDNEGRFTLANEKVRQLFPLMSDTVVPGRRFEEMLRIGIARGAYPDAIGREEAWIAEAMAFWHLDEPEVERTVRLANGRWVMAIDRRLAEGGWISLRIDITEIKRGESRLAAILDGSGHGTWEWDVASRSLRASTLMEQTIDHWLASVGHGRADVGENPTAFFRGLVHPEDLARLDAAMARHLAGATERLDIEIRQRHRAGHWTWGRVRGKISARDPEGRPQRVAGVIVDITDLKTIQLDLERSARLKLEFLERISHEIRTPLNGVLGALSLLGTGPETQERARLIRTAEESGARLVALIDRLVDLTRLEDGQLAPEPAPVTLDTLAAELRDAHGPAAACKGIALDILTDRTASEPRGADAGQLRRLLDQLLDHAIARTARGTVELKIRTPDIEWVRFDLADDGPARDEAARARLFEPLYHEAGNARPEAEAGDGLGLLAAKRRAEALGGTLALADRPGGRALRLDLPLPRIA